MTREPSIDPVAHLHQGRSLVVNSTLEHSPRRIICQGTLQVHWEAWLFLECVHIQCMDIVASRRSPLRIGSALVRICFRGKVPGASLRIDDTSRSGSDGIADIVAAGQVGNQERLHELSVYQQLSSSRIKFVHIVLLRDGINVLLVSRRGVDEWLRIELCRRLSAHLDYRPQTGEELRTLGETVVVALPLCTP
jgi:hypothetical protein